MMALAQAAVADESAPNHPSAKWMAAIAWMSHNMVVGCLMGSFSVMLAPVQERLHVALEKAAVGMLLVLVGSALTGPFVGVLIARFSLRRVRVGRMSIRGARSSHDSGGCAAQMVNLVPRSSCARLPPRSVRISTIRSCWHAPS